MPVLATAKTNFPSCWDARADCVPAQVVGWLDLFGLDRGGLDRAGLIEFEWATGMERVYDLNEYGIVKSKLGKSRWWKS